MTELDSVLVFAKGYRAQYRENACGQARLRIRECEAKDDVEGSLIWSKVADAIEHMDALGLPRSAAAMSLAEVREALEACAGVSP